MLRFTLVRPTLTSLALRYSPFALNLLRVSLIEPNRSLLRQTARFSSLSTGDRWRITKNRLDCGSSTLCSHLCLVQTSLTRRISQESLYEGPQTQRTSRNLSNFGQQTFFSKRILDPRFFFRFLLFIGEKIHSIVNTSVYMRYLANDRKIRETEFVYYPARTDTHIHTHCTYIIV